MGLRSLKIDRSYETRNGIDVVSHFYIPTLSESVSYDRIAGFFSSKSIAINSRGIYELLKNRGKIRMLVSPILSRQDVDILNDLYNGDVILDTIDRNVFMEEDEVLQNYTKLFAWLVREGLLDLKMVLVKDSDGLLCDYETIDKSALFHQKVGIFRDDCNDYITFSGSVNETANAWLKNSEEFKIFKSWEEGQKEFCEIDVSKFEEIWNDEREDLIVKDLPTAVRDKFYDLGDIDVNITVSRIKDHLNKVSKNERISLFHYQYEALEKWRKNDRKMLFEMATGTGKTRTAIACMEDSLLNKLINVIVVATPEVTLTKQWIKEVASLFDFKGKEFLLASGHDNWLNIEKEFYRIKRGTSSSMIIYTTHDTCSGEKFINLVSKMNCDEIKFLFIGDEVHKLGSDVRGNGLFNFYNERIGLSATPSRWYDDEGTRKLEKYFNDVCFEFDIKKALNTLNPLTMKPFLTKYYYFPIMNTLTDEEMKEYIRLSDVIRRNMWRSDESNKFNPLVSNRNKRADIIKNAENKIANLRRLLLSFETIEKLIIFVSPRQINDVSDLLSELNIQHATFTESTGKNRKAEYGNLSEREHVITCFKRLEIKAIVAIKCLDEGIDIPVADTAILLSSTTNPREYVQRIGRVVRSYEGKKSATIYDFYVKSTDSNESIDNKELKRIANIANNAMNSFDSIDSYYKEGYLWD